MNCQEYRELIEDSLDVSLHGEPEHRVKRHLEHCEACRAYFEVRRAEHAALFSRINAACAELHLPDGFSDRLVASVRARQTARRGWRRLALPRWALIAASVAVMAGFVFAATVVVDAVVDNDSEGTEGTQATEGTDGSVAPAAPAEVVSDVPYVPDVASVPSIEPDSQHPSSNNQPENEKGETKMNIKQKAVATLAAATLATAGFAANEMTYSFAWYSGPTVTNFQTPITLREGVNGFSYGDFASDDGSDLRIKDSGGNLLPYEIEQWNASGDSLVWVKVPTLSAATTITLSWGDANAPAASAVNIWDDSYMVFHLGECGAKESAQGISFTQTANVKVDGTLAKGTSFTGRSDTDKRISGSFAESYLDNNAKIDRFTFSFWMKADDFTTTGTYLTYFYRDSGTQFDILYNFDSNRARKITLYTVSISGTNPASESAIDVPDLGWHHYAYTYDGTTLRMYRDGVQTKEKEITFAVPASTHPTWNPTFRVGGHAAGNMFAGSLDEFRFEKVARSADWLAACYATRASSGYYMEFPEYGRNAVLEDFPLMLALNKDMPGLSEEMQSAIYNRANLHFFTEDGATELFAEPESTPNVGTVTYWVKMPRFTKGSKVLVRSTAVANDTSIVYSTNNWDSSYYHVWHFAAGANKYYDSASVGPLHLDTGSRWTNFAASVTGPTGIYGALQCGKNMATYLELKNDTRPLTDRYTISFWARKNAADFANPHASYVFQMRQSSSPNRQISVLTGFRNKDNDFYLWDSAGGDGPHVPIPDAGWHHYAFTCDGTATKGYRDGVEVVSGAVFNFNLPSGITEWYRLTMGSQRWAPTAESFYGDLDEFRMELEPRSADWIYASYRTQRGLVDGIACTAKPAFGTERSVSASGLNTLDLTANLICRVASDVTFFYGAEDAGTTAASWDGSVSLGAKESGLLTVSLGSLTQDQGVVGRFRAVNAYGEAWSEPMSGRAWAEPYGAYAKIIVTNYTGEAALVDFPLCVKLPASVGLPAESTGLRFIDADGRSLAFEIEKWEPSGESVAWVRLPSLVNGMKIRAVWGDVFAVRGAVHADAVWNSDYQGVYHLASAQDSSPNKRNFGTDTLSDVVTGIVGTSREFTGRSGSMSIENDDLMTDLSGAFSVSGWIKPAADATGSHYLFQFHNGTYQFAALYNFDAARRLNLYSYPNINAYADNQQNADLRNVCSPMTIPDDGGWHHFAYTYDGSGFSAYLDGELLRNMPRNYSLGSGYPKLQNWKLSLGQTTGQGNKFKGLVDELRFESVKRSADWVKACYLNQKDALVSVRSANTGMIIFVR